MLLYRQCERDIRLSQDWTKEDTKPNVQKHSCKSKVFNHKIGGLKMWIRSQDRKILVDTKEIFIEEVYGTMIFCCTDGGEDQLLGQYSIHEKALKVLDEIQGCITGNRFTNNYEIVRDCKIAGTELHGVYTMPKDDEVEV